MTSRRSHVAGLALPPLSEIINLEPEKEPWCAGYAPSKGRRCQAPTNARGRSSAMALLHQGTKDLRAGRCIDELLEDLAPHVVCKQSHQGQALDLAHRWQSKVRTFLDSQAASMRPARQASRSSRSPYPGTTQGNMEERTALLYRRLRDTMEELRLLEADLDGPTITARSIGDRDTRFTRGENGSRSARSSETRIVQPGITSHRPRTSQSTESVNRSAPPHVGRQESVLPRAGARPATVPRAARASGENIDRHALGAARQGRSVAVMRRGIEGECGICMCDLKASQKEDEKEAEDHVEEDQENDDQYDGPVGTAGEEEELVWCKARCGNNFHKHCIDQWLETAHAPTCPACRSNWKH